MHEDGIKNLVQKHFFYIIFMCLDLQNVCMHRVIPEDDQWDGIVCVRSGHISTCQVTLG